MHKRGDAKIKNSLAPSVPKKMRENLIYGIVLVLVAGGLTAALIYGISQSERTECFRWKTEAEKFPGYYLTNWQKAQCDYHGIEIAAPVK